MITRWAVLVVACASLGGSLAARAASVSIAAAANLTFVIEALSAEFERAHPGTRVTTTLGASGNLSAQIRHGAPFDVFLSADTEHPEALVEAGFAERSTLRAFACGRLAFWTTRRDLTLGDLAEVVRSERVRKLAFAQPAVAPYGRAAVSALRRLGVWTVAERKAVLGENVAQAAQFVETGNADAGLIALSFVVAPRLEHRGQWVEVPAALYADVSLAQGMVITRHGAANRAAREFLEFIGSEKARGILRAHGYGPGEPAGARP